MASNSIVPMVVLSKDLKASFRPGTMLDVVQGKIYYWQPEMGGLGKVAEGKVDFKHHKTPLDKRVYRSFFSWLIKDGRMHVVKEIVKTEIKTNGKQKENISEGKGLFD